MEFLTGKDYPHLCEICQSQIDSIASIMEDLEDTDDEEFPCNFVYDNNLFCGGQECKNHKRIS
jgi:hypothetical protein